MSKPAGKGSNIQVCVRVRPLVRREKENGEVMGWKWDKQIPHVLQSIEGSKEYSFDHLFTTEHTTDDIYRDVISEIVASTMLGYHGSVFSYGQTASGKTFTMNGTAKQPGIIPIAIFDAFEAVEKFPDRIFLFRVCYLEVYKEQVKDLLNPDPTSNANIKIQFDESTKSAVVRGVKEQVVMNAVQVMSLLQSGEMYRHVGATDMNEQSSRAHTVFRLIVESKDASGGPRAPIRTSTLCDYLHTALMNTLTLWMCRNLIDLAGSENASMSNSTGERAIEAKAINQSLLTLSMIIQRLSEMKKGDAATTAMHLPFRDSKLTRILQEPLSGNAFVAIVCTISPSARCADESNNTLRFAARAKKVNLRAQVNEGDANTLISQYEEEIANLKAKIAQMETMSVGGSLPLANADSDELEDRDNILRMIDEMNRYIIKADGSIEEARERSIVDRVLSKWKKRAGILGGDSADSSDPKDELTGAVSTWRHKDPKHAISSSAFEAAAASGQSASKGPRELLSSVSNMLEVLKEKVVQRPVRKMSLTKSQEGVGDTKDTSTINSMDFEKLKLELRLKMADAAFLEQELAKKDSLLQQLVEGLNDIEMVQQQWEAELNGVKDELASEKEDNAFLREKIHEYLELSDPAANPSVTSTSNVSVDGLIAEIERLRHAVALERAEADNLRDKISEISYDRNNWRQKYSLLYAKRKERLML